MTNHLERVGEGFVICLGTTIIGGVMILLYYAYQWLVAPRLKLVLLGLGAVATAVCVFYIIGYIVERLDEWAESSHD